MVTDCVVFCMCRAKFYGDDGYLKLPRGAHDCGISSDPAVAVVNAKYVVPGRQEAAMLEVRI